MRILVLSNCPLDPRLGSGQTRLAWSEGLRALGHEVTVWDSEALVPPGERGRGYRWRLGYRAHRRLAATGAERFDLVECFGAEFWLPTWRTTARPASRRPLVVAHTDGLEPACTARLREAGLGGDGGRLRSLVNQLSDLAFSRADAFVTASESDRTFARARGWFREDRMEVIPIGLRAPFLAAAERPLAVATREERIAFLGTWLDRKGARWIPRIIEPLLNDRPSLRAAFLGVGVDEHTVRDAFAPALRSRIDARRSLSPEEILAELARAPVFFLPAEYEGFGLATAEAMCAGCAVVTTPTGFGAALRDGVEALVCPFADPTAMTAALRRLLDDEPLRQRIAEAGRRRAASLRWETSVARLEQTYRRWLDEHRDPRAR